MVALPPSDRKIQANRLNAQRSTGPRTPDGKARAARNAVTHGVYSRDLVLPGESQAELDALRDGLVAELRPRGAAEAVMVEQFLAAAWKLRRVRAAEQVLAGEHARGSRLAALGGLLAPNEGHERLAKLEERLGRTLHRCLRELRLLRKDAAEQEEPAPEDDVAEDEAPPPSPEQNEPTADADVQPSGAREVGVRNEPTVNAPAGAGAPVAGPVLAPEPPDGA